VTEVARMCILAKDALVGYPKSKKPHHYLRQTRFHSSHERVIHILQPLPAAVVANKEDVCHLVSKKEFDTDIMGSLTEPDIPSQAPPLHSSCCASSEDL